MAKFDLDTMRRLAAAHKEEMETHLLKGLAYGSSCARMYHDGSDQMITNCEFTRNTLATREDAAREHCKAWKKESRFDTGEVSWVLDWNDLGKELDSLLQSRNGRLFMKRLHEDPKECLDTYFGKDTHRAVMLQTKNDHPVQRRLREMAMGFGSGYFGSDTNTTSSANTATWKTYYTSKVMNSNRVVGMVTDDVPQPKASSERKLVQTFPFRLGHAKTPLDKLQSEYDHFAGKAYRHLFG